MKDQKKKSNKKVGYVLSYKDPNYIRTKSILGALAKSDKLKVFTAINQSTGVLRYFDTIGRLIYLRIFHNPDVYILGFRGHEIFLPVRLLTLGKPLIFDEFIVMTDWASSEHNKVSKGSPAYKLIVWYQRLILRWSELILSDTPEHAILSSELHDIDINKYTTLYVGCDESIFNTTPPKNKNLSKNEFIVFYYGTGLPLHGFDYILDAANILKDEKEIVIEIVGGKGKPDVLKQIKEAVKNNQLQNIKHKPWLKISDLSEHIKNSNICLGGPFGGTGQAGRVITGKTFQFIASKKPVVLGGNPVNHRFFKDKENCIFAEQSSPESIADSIFWCYNNQKSLNKIAENGYKVYQKNFSVNQIMKQLVSSIDSLI